MKIFVSYAHKDEDLKKELLKHLAGFKRKGMIEIWHDREIIPGQKWGAEIDRNLEEAHIILLLISPDFIASDYCNDIELKCALAKHEDQNDPAIVIPIILRNCPWELEPFGAIQCLPKGGKAVTNWNSLDEAFTDVAMGLNKVFKSRQNQTSNMVYKKGLESILAEPDTNEAIIESFKYDCDRTKQGETFKEHFYNNEGRSLLQFGFVCGEENQQVDSFFHRMYLEVLSDYADHSIIKINVKENHYPTFKFGNTLEGSKNKFRRILQGLIRQEPDETLKKDFTSYDLINLKSIKPFKILVFQFKVYSHDCFKTNHGSEFVDWLLNEFFQANIKFSTDIKIVFFFCLTFNHRRNIFSSITSKKSKLINKIVSSINTCEIFDSNEEVAQVFCKMDELQSVENRDLQDWFSKLYSNPETIKTIINTLFGMEDKKRAMSEIELQIHPIIDYFLNKENQITR